MSANNYILIEQLKNGWRVGMRDADLGRGLGKNKVFKELESACRASQDILDEDNVEYGICFKFKEETI